MWSQTLARSNLSRRWALRAADVSTRRLRRPPRAAAVAPGAPLHGTSHAQDAGVEVDVLPHQAERLPLAQPEGQRDRPACSIQPSTRGLQDGPALVRGQRFDLGALHPRRPGQGGGVGHQALAPHGLVEAGAQDAMHAVHDMGRPAVVHQLAVEPLEGLGAQLGQPRGSEGRDDVHAQVAGVPGAGLPPHRERQYLLEPVLEPLLERDGVEQPRLLPAVAGVLQLAHGGVELALGRPAEVPAVALPVQAAPDGDPGVPPAVGAAISRRGAVTVRGAWPTAHPAYPASASRIDATNRSSSARSTRTERPR